MAASRWERTKPFAAASFMPWSDTTEREHNGFPLPRSASTPTSRCSNMPSCWIWSPPSGPHPWCLHRRVRRTKGPWGQRSVHDRGPQDAAGLRRSGDAIRETTNPAVATADGSYMAFRAERLSAIWKWYSSPDHSIALRGYGGRLVTEAVRRRGQTDRQKRRYADAIIIPRPNWPRAMSSPAP